MNKCDVTGSLKLTASGFLDLLTTKDATVRKLEGLTKTVSENGIFGKVILPDIHLVIKNSLSFLSSVSVEVLLCIFLSPRSILVAASSYWDNTYMLIMIGDHVYTS